MEDVIVRCKSKYDFETLKRFNRFHMYSKPIYKVVTVLAIFLILYAIFVPDDDILMRVIIGIIGVIWILEVIFLPISFSKKAMKTSKLNNEVHTVAEFFKDRIEIETIRNNKSIGSSTIEYGDVYKICDTKHALYVYISSNQAFVCNKANLEGDYDKLVSILKEKLGKKYKKKGK